MFHSRRKLRSTPTQFERAVAELLKEKPVTLGLREATLQFQRAMIRVVLARHKQADGYNLSAVARELGLPRNSLYAFLSEM